VSEFKFGVTVAVIVYNVTRKFLARLDPLSFGHRRKTK
jgi:hypothetical protein